MPRNRTISQNIALLVSSGYATGAHGSNLYNIWGLQSLSYSWSNPKQDVQVYGLAAPIARETVESPDVSLDFSYLVTNANNEYRMGLQSADGSVSILSRILAGSPDEERNYFIFVAPDGQDAVGIAGMAAGNNQGVVGIGNGRIASYSIEGAVGGFPTASVKVQGLNLKTYTSGLNCPIPAVNPTTGVELGSPSLTFNIPQIANAYTSGLFGTNTVNGQISGVPDVIRPGDISLTLSSAGGVFYDFTAPCVQSFSCSFDLSLAPIQCLGSRFAASRNISFPINVNFEVEMLAKDIQTGSLATYLCDTGRYNATINMRRPSCTGDGATALGITLRNVSLEGQEVSTSVGGDPQTVKTTWVGQVGAYTDVTNGIFMSGAYTGVNGIY